MLLNLNDALWLPRNFFRQLPDWSARKVSALAISIAAGAGILRAVAFTFVASNAPRPGAADLVVPALTTLVVILLPAVCFYLLVGRGKQVSLERTVACLAWAQAPMMFAAIPVVGWTIAELWSLWLSAASVHYAFETSWAASFGALALAWMMLVVAFVALYLVLAH